MTLQKQYTPGCLITKGPVGCVDRFLIPTDGSEYVIGSGQSSSMPVENSFISKEHLALGSESGACYIKDLNSTNGTRLRDEVIEADQRYTIVDGDEITLAEGELVLMFRTHVAMVEEAGRLPQLRPREDTGDLGIYVDLGKHEVYIDGKKVLPDIQGKPFELLALLFESDGNLVTMGDISLRLWEDRWEKQEAKLDAYGVVVEEEYWYEDEDSKTNPGEIHQLVRRLRRRLKEYSDFEYVQSVRGGGYKLIGSSK